MKTANTVRLAYEQGSGVLRLAPMFVPAALQPRPGRRLRLHPDDYFALGTERGSIKERWFSSVIPAMNGPLAPADEGMSYVAASGRRRGQVHAQGSGGRAGRGAHRRGAEEKYGAWPMYSKFFDYQAPLFHHLHLTTRPRGRVGRLGKPEAYYFPPQLNNHLGDFPATYFGFDPDVTRDEVSERLLHVRKGRQPHHRALARLPHRARHRLVYAAGRRARPGLGV